MTIIKTNEFILRPIILSDADSFFESMKDVETIKNFTSTPKTLSEAKLDIAKMIEKSKLKVSEPFAIQVEGKYAGYVIIEYQNWNPKNDTGRVHICIHPDFRGKGLATKVLVEITNYGFTAYKFKKIIAQCKATNEGVAKANAKAGFKLDKIVKVDGIDKMAWIKENPFIKTR